MHKSRAQHAEKFVSGDSRSLLTPCPAPPAVVWYLFALTHLDMFTLHLQL